jgi:hypothetical protein
MSLDPDQLEISSLINDNTGQSVSLDAFPTWNDDNCSQIAVTWEDDVFEVVPDACFKIIRHWKLIDWCQYDPVTGCGLWEYTQTIKVLDDVEPEFPNCEDVTICDTAAVGCTGLADLVLEVQECTPDDMLKASYKIFAFEDADEPDFCNNFVDLDVQINEITNRATVTRTGVITSPVPVVGGDVIQYTTDGGATFRTYTSPFLLPDDLNDVLIIRTVQYEDGCDTDITFYGLSLDATRYYPFGTHRIQWYVEDMCGNWNTCDIDFTVEDCKKPSPVCINGLSSVVMPVNGVVNIAAEAFDAASFDNCDTDLDFRIWHPIMDSSFYMDQSNDWERPTASSTGDDVLENLPVEAFFNCPAITNGESETFIVEIYVVDDFGNWDFCTTFITIDDNDDVCNGISSSVVIAGAISNESDEAVDNVDVRLQGGILGQMDITQQNDELGHFAFSGLPMSQNWEVSSQRNDDHLNGVTTYDLALIQRHILGLESLDTPYKLIAADADDNGNINILDIVDLRKLILGLYNELPSNQSWRFVDANATFPAGLTQPPADYPELVSYVGVSISMMGTDFVAVKIGDVNGSATPNDAVAGDTRNLTESLIFSIDDQAVTEGEVVSVDVKSSNFDAIIGYQFTLAFDNSLLQYVGVEAGALNVTEANFGLHLLDRGIMTTSWNDVNGINVDADEVLFTLVFKANTDGKISNALNANSARTVAEAYSQANGIVDVALEFNTDQGVIKSDAFALYQNTPNPFVESTIIGFVLPEAAEATLTIYDLTGRVLRTIDGAYAKGYNQVTLNRSGFGSAGVLYYQLDTEGYTATKKMIVAE